MRNIQNSAKGKKKDQLLAKRVAALAGEVIEVKLRPKSKWKAIEVRLGVPSIALEGLEKVWTNPSEGCLV